MCAHQDKGYKACRKTFWDHLGHLCRDHRVSFLAGDFNMALFATPRQMGARYIEARCWGPYAWRTTSGMGAVAGSTPPAVAGEVRFDSMGLFAIGAAPSVAPWLSTQVLAGVHTEKRLECFPKGQGYEAKSYVGGIERVEDCLTTRGDSTNKMSAPTHGDGDDPPPHPHIKQKPINHNIWDTGDAFFRAGAHMPLLFFIGDRSRRS